MSPDVEMIMTLIVSNQLCIAAKKHIQQKKEYEDIRLLTGLKFDDKASDIIPRMQTCLEIHGVKKTVCNTFGEDHIRNGNWIFSDITNKNERRMHRPCDQWRNLQDTMKRIDQIGWSASTSWLRICYFIYDRCQKIPDHSGRQSYRHVMRSGIKRRMTELLSNNKIGNEWRAPSHSWIDKQNTFTETLKNYV